MKAILWRSVLGASIALNMALGAAIYEGITTRHALAALVRPPPVSEKFITFWGDSLTEGAGASLHHEMPATIGFALNREVFNGGVGGQTSAQIRDRMLARNPGLDRSITVIWAGRNDKGELTDTVENVSRMAESLPEGGKFLILGVTNAEYEPKGSPGYERIRAMNTQLAARFPGRFVDTWSFLLSHADLTNEAEIAENGREIIPRRLRFDAVHFNNNGYALVAAQVIQEIERRGW